MNENPFVVVEINLKLFIQHNGATPDISHVFYLCICFHFFTSSLYSIFHIFNISSLITRFTNSKKRISKPKKSMKFSTFLKSVYLRYQKPKNKSLQQYQYREQQ